MRKSGSRGGRPSRNIMHGGNASKRGISSLRGLPNKGRGMREGLRSGRNKLDNKKHMAPIQREFDTTIKGKPPKPQVKLNVFETRFTIPESPQNANIHGQQIVRASIGKACVVEHIRRLSEQRSGAPEEGKIEELQ